MNCQTTITPEPETIDIPALKAKYKQEREKRLRKEHGAQYVSLSGDVVENYAVDPHEPVKPRDPISEEIDAVILGGGWSGITAARHMQKAGITDFRHIDTAGNFGGCWYWNRYPGVQCDNDAYCYLPLLEETGFLPSKKFSDGWEIHDYFQLIADKFGFREKALFHTQITSLTWDEPSKRWIVKTNRGDDIRARFVIMAGGVLNMPKLPGIKGIDTFKGKMFHTSRWDYEYTGGSWRNPELTKLADKRVAIVGTGATSIQAVPALGKHAKQLYVLQRTPSSVDERPNPATDPEWAKSLKPGWQKERQENFHRAANEVIVPGEGDLICDIWTEINRNLDAELEAEGRPQLSLEEYFARAEVMDFRVMERLRARVDAIVEDKATAEALKPYYRFRCKRPLSNNDYYPTFNRPNVKLIDVSETQGLQEITEKGFIANGVEYEVDCIIFASGFEVTSDLKRRWGIPVVEGVDGVSIYDHWADGPRTIHGAMTHGFPNMFFTGYVQGGLNSTTTEQFSQQGLHAAYIMAETLKRGGKAAEPTQEGEDAYVKHFFDVEVDASEFVDGCPPSYFNNEGEKNSKWALFRGYGPGWGAFMKLLSDWREQGQLEGIEIRN